MRRIVSAVLLAATISSCASLKSLFGGTGSEVRYERTAMANLRRGEAELKGKNFTDANKYFEYVISKFPYLEEAKLAELRLADSDYARGRYIEARDRYENFVRHHPTHADVEYAAYRVALTHYRNIPSGMFFLPPQSEKEQTEVASCQRALNYFVLNYPDSSYVAAARKLKLDVVRRLVAHELYVANFYRSRKKWPGVVGRLETVVQKFDGGNEPGKVYLDLYEAYLKTSQPDKAKATLEAFVAKFPSDKEAGRARTLLTSLQT